MDQKCNHRVTITAVVKSVICPTLVCPQHKESQTIKAKQRYDGQIQLRKLNLQEHLGKGDLAVLKIIQLYTLDDFWRL